MLLIKFPRLLFSNFFSLMLITYNLSAHDCLSFKDAKEIYAGFPNKPINNLSFNFTLEEAYCGQEKVNYLIKKEHDDPIGYKVGFTNKTMQEMFKISEPATGIIYKHMFLDNNSSINYDFGYRVMIEPDILVVIKSENIMTAKNDIEILENISSIHPYIEIISLRFKEETKLNANMIIASNMLATKMMMGKGVKIKANKQFLEKLADINTVFIKDKNTILQEAKTSNLMGHPINVLKWLINDLNKKGKKLKKDDHVSLGSIGKLFPVKKNSSYEYQFNNLEERVGLNINFN